MSEKLPQFFLMTTLCPKCHHLRPADTTAPTWQCPACGVAYVKAAEALRSPAAAPRPVIARHEPRRIPWLKLLMAIAYGAWTRWQLSQRGGLSAGLPGSVTRPSVDSIRAPASSVKADEGGDGHYLGLSALCLGQGLAGGQWL